MRTLAQFREPIKEARTGENLWAYRMDNETETVGMAESVGLLNCSCCDYFRFVEDVPILMEMTALMRWKSDKESQYAYLESEKDQFIHRLAKWENRLKVYGSMLVLCRHARRSSEVANKLDDGKHKFWLVVSDEKGPVVSKVFRNLQADLRSELRHGENPNNVLADVAVFSIDSLARRLFPN